MDRPTADSPNLAEMLFGICFEFLFPLSKGPILKAARIPTKERFFFRLKKVTFIHGTVKFKQRIIKQSCD